MKWLRVTHAHPCTCCGRPDWCMISEDGHILICMRTPGGKVKTFKDGQIGYIYRAGEAVPVTVPKPETEPLHVDAERMLCDWQATTTGKQMDQFAKLLGVTMDSLYSLGACWARERGGWAFPMYDGDRNLVGIRLRFETFKLTVKGTHAGLFLPATPPPRTIHVCEGPTSCAAGLSLGYYTVGLPSNGAGVEHLKQFIRRNGVREAVVWADNKVYDDGRQDAGIEGANRVANQLPVPNICCVLAAKDLREFAQSGLSRTIISDLMETKVWRRP